MDKRFTPLSPAEQLMARKQAIEDVLAHPEWTLQQSVLHLKRSMRLTSAEMAKMGVWASRSSMRLTCAPDRNCFVKARYWKYDSMAVTANAGASRATKSAFSRASFSDRLDT